MNEKGVPMECFVLLMLFVFMSPSWPAGFGLGTGPHGQARAYELLTQRFGGLFQRGGLLRRCSTRFRYGQTWFVVTPGSADRPADDPGGRAVARRPHRLATGNPHTDGPSSSADCTPGVPHRRQRVQPAFPGRAGKATEESRRLLSDGVRWQINRLAQSPQPSPIRISIRHGRLIVEKFLAIKRAEELEEFTQLCIELYDQAMLTRSEGIEFLGDANEAVPIEDPICQVCGEKIVSDMVYCRRCFTPHHLDCWQYNGLCSTYGCRETRYSIPTVAQPITQARRRPFRPREAVSVTTGPTLFAKQTTTPPRLR